MRADLFAPLLQMRDAYGRNDLRNNALARNSKTRNLFNINEVTQAINEGKGGPETIAEVAQTLRGIELGKVGFIKHLLGLGDTPTIDAVELNFWLTGKGSTRPAAPAKGSITRQFHNYFSKLAAGGCCACFQAGAGLSLGHDTSPSRRPDCQSKPTPTHQQ